MICRRADGYIAVPASDVEDARLGEFEKVQERFEEESEKLLMAVYDALYKARLSDMHAGPCKGMGLGS